MKYYTSSKKVLGLVGSVIALVGVGLPGPSQAAVDAGTLISAFMGSGLTGGGGGQFVNGDPANQVIPLLQQIYRQNADNGGVDNNGKRLQTETAMKIADYQEQNQWERERRLRDDEIARSYPEMSNLSCAVATANQSAPLIDAAADNVTGQVRQLLNDGMYSSVLLATSISEKNKALVWCKLGSTGKKGKCEVAADPLVMGAELGHDDAITIKDSIPCDMPGVIQEFQQMKNPEGWTPNARHKECVAAILSIANEYPIANSRPTKEEASSDDGTMIWGKKTNKIAMSSGSKGTILQKFNERVSVPTSMGCEKGIRGGGRDMYSLLEAAYGSQKRSPPEPNFGLPPSGFCLSKLQFSYGQQLMAEDNERQEAGKRNLIQLTEDANAISLINTRSAYHFRKAAVGSGNSSGLENMDSDVAPRRVASFDQKHEELLGAIRQLTSEIQKMNTGLYSDKLQEVSVKKGSKHRAPVGASGSDKAAEVTDALKEMGIKVSQPATGKVLAPIAQEFPVLPPQ